MPLEPVATARDAVDHPVDPHQLGRVLRRLRVRSGTTQVELARRTGITQPVISLYERGARIPRADTFALLVQALGAVLRAEPLGEAVVPSSDVRPSTGRPMDPALVARVLPDVLGLAAAIPGTRSGPLTFPRLPARG